MAIKTAMASVPLELLDNLQLAAFNSSRHREFPEDAARDSAAGDQARAILAKPTQSEAVGRYLEPGPRYRGAERVPQIRSYAEFPAESVKNSDGVWLEGEQVYTRPDGRLDPRPELAVVKPPSTDDLTLLAQIGELHALLEELQSARPLLLYGAPWIERIAEVLARHSNAVPASLECAK